LPVFKTNNADSTSYIIDWGHGVIDTMKEPGGPGGYQHEKAIHYGNK